MKSFVDGYLRPAAKNSNRSPSTVTDGGYAVPTALDAHRRTSAAISPIRAIARWCRPAPRTIAS
jgi:predicted phage gp36 major capsid-like protein